MNRSWITALTVASVAGSGGAFAGVMANTQDVPAAAPLPAPVNQAAFLRTETQVAPTRTIDYQVGAAGTATLAIAGGSLTISNAAAGNEWTVANATAPGAHVAVQFTDGTQLVTFTADLVGTDVVVSLTNVPVPGAAAAEPINATVVKTVAATHPTTTSQPQPATPPATVAPAVTQPPATSATTAPSGSGDDGRHGDDHEQESNDD